MYSEVDFRRMCLPVNRREIRSLVEAFVPVDIEEVVALRGELLQPVSFPVLSPKTGRINRGKADRELRRLMGLNNRLYRLIYSDDTLWNFPTTFLLTGVYSAPARKWVQELKEQMKSFCDQAMALEPAYGKRCSCYVQQRTPWEYMVGKSEAYQYIKGAQGIALAILWGEGAEWHRFSSPEEMVGDIQEVERKRDTLRREVGALLKRQQDRERTLYAHYLEKRQKIMDNTLGTPEIKHMAAMVYDSGFAISDAGTVEVLPLTKAENPE